MIPSLTGSGPAESASSADRLGDGEPRGDPGTPGDPALSLAGVTHGFDGTPVLDGVDLRVGRGETLAVIGPSGTGKTTLLRLLAGFHPPDSGRVALGGTDLWSLSKRDRRAVRRRVGMVFQEANLFDASVRANASYGLRIRRDWPERIRSWLGRLAGGDAEPAATEALELVGLGGDGDRSAASLSGGEAQRVAFARAIAYDPAFLLLDEPTSDLDPRNTAAIEAAVETARERGVGVAVATHDMRQAERVADRVAVVLDGRVVEVGPAERVFEDPRNERTRKFIAGELVY